MADVMCSWCHELNSQNGLALTPYCIFCGHRGDKPRSECDCPKCWKPVDGVDEPGTPMSETSETPRDDIRAGLRDGALAVVEQLQRQRAELLDALRVAEDALDWYAGEGRAVANGALETVRVAIAKAEGR